MAGVDREGRFKAFPIEWGIDSKDSGAVQLAMKFAISQYLNPETNQWDDWSEFGMEETGFFNLIKKDGNVNDKQVASLIEALGWDGAGFKSLQEGDWSQKCVQVTVQLERSEAYGDKLRISWINPENWEGFELKKLDSAAIKALDGRLGGKLRAIAPKAAAPAKPAARPPAPRAAAPAPAAEPLEPGSTEPDEVIGEEPPAEEAAPVAAPAPTKPPVRRPPTPGKKTY